MFLNVANKFKAGFDNRKQNYPNREWNYFSYFVTSNRKNFFFMMFLNFANEFKTSFENRKWNYPNRKLNYFSYFLTSNQRTSFTNCPTHIPQTSITEYKPYKI